MIEIIKLQYLLAVVEHGGFRRAAEAIHLTQPALTKSIKSLEEIFGTPLLDRRFRPIVPTPFGKIVVDRSRRLIADLKQMKREVDLLKGFQSGELVVGCDPYVAKSLIAPALARLVTSYPKLHYEVEVAGWPFLKEKLLNRQIDLHVGAPPDVYDARVSTIEFALPPVVYFCRAGHPLARKRKIASKELMLYPNIGMEPHPAITRWYAEVMGVPPNSDEALRFRFAKSNDWEILREVVRMTDSISGGPREVFQNDLAAGDLHELKLEATQPKIFGTIAYLSDRILPPAAEALIGEIKKVIPRLMENPAKIKA